MREHNEQGTPRLLEIGAERGFPGNVGSIDCMHWPWKTCPSGHHGMYKGQKSSLLLYWKSSHLKIYGYGMHSLACLVHTMT
jgi:hypothetical protein